MSKIERLPYAMLLLFGIQSTLTEALENIVIMEGSEGSLKCPSTSGNCIGVDWRKKSPTMITPITISRGNIVQTSVDTGRYSVSGSSGCNLRIRKVRLEDGGLFDCEYIDTEKNTITKLAFLIVLKSYPTCIAGVNASAGEEAEGDGVQLSCELIFSGIEKASMTLKNLDVSVSERSGNNLKLTHWLVAARPEIPSYECVTTFEIPGNIRGLAENIPVAPTCETKEFKLRYPVKTVSLTPKLSVYSPGTVITCSSDGNPSPSYKWQIIDAINDGKCDNWRDISGETDNEIIVNSVTSNFYRCVASNIVRGSLFMAFSESFQVHYTQRATVATDAVSTTEVHWVVFFFVGVLCALISGLFVFFLLKHFRYIQFHRHPTQRSAADRDGQRQYMNMEIVTGRPTEAPTAAQDTTGVVNERAYSSLGDDRKEERGYAWLGARPISGVTRVKMEPGQQTNYITIVG